MQAAVFYGPEKISLERAACPQDRPSLKVSSCAVCGYDARVFRNGHRKVRPPVILGHEVCGVLTERVAMNHETLPEGTRVALCPIIPCLDCEYCRDGQYNMCADLKEVGSTHDGGFAQYVSIPDQTLKIGGLVKVPDGMGDEEASLLEPLACCINSLQQLGSLSDTRPVVIIGDGPVGLLHLQLFRNLGARTVVVGKIPSRMQKARSIGAHAVFEYGDDAAAKVLDFAGSNSRIGTVVIATSSPSAFSLVEKIAGKNSKVSLFAGMPTGQKLSFDANWLHYNQVSITGSFSSLPHTLKEAAWVAAEGIVDLSAIVSHRYSLDRIEEAINVTENYVGLRAVINRFEC
ncbi:MAG TPA: alcohol dehydrogenase catalytic domain-containing protein [Nitrososphaera sp.]|nr:alcohol dehydrogenase catalytic domain-containing protein [Nitrososphaera sp.]